MATGFSAPPSEHDVSILNAELHNAAQIAVSSGSSLLSLTSSTERQRRVDLARAKRELVEARASEAVDLARAKRELAETRVNEVQAELDFAAGSQAGSVGRRLSDVWSEGDLSAHDARRVTTQQTFSTYSTPTSPTTVAVLPQGGLRRHLH